MYRGFACRVQDLRIGASENEKENALGSHILLNNPYNTPPSKTYIAPCIEFRVKLICNKEFFRLEPPTPCTGFRV